MHVHGKWMTPTSWVIENPRSCPSAVLHPHNAHKNPSTKREESPLIAPSAISRNTWVAFFSKRRKRPAIKEEGSSSHHSYFPLWSSRVTATLDTPNNSQSTLLLGKEQAMSKTPWTITLTKESTTIAECCDKGLHSFSVWFDKIAIGNRIRRECMSVIVILVWSVSDNTFLSRIQGPWHLIFFSFRAVLFLYPAEAEAVCFATIWAKHLNSENVRPFGSCRRLVRFYSSVCL